MAKVEKVKLTKNGKTVEFSAVDIEYMKKNGWKEVQSKLAKGGK